MYNEDDLFGDPVPQDDNTGGQQDNQNQNNDDDFSQQYQYNSKEDEDDIFGEPGDTNNDDQNNDDANTDKGDFMSRYLRSKKVDKSKIRIFNNETQEEEEVDFDTLTDDEKIALLDMINQPMLSDSEIEAINFMRQHKLDLNSYAESIKQQVMKEVGNKPTSELQNISDDDLFRFDLIDRYGFDQEKDADEIEAILEKEKENESLYQRKVGALRKEYEKLEEDRHAAEQQEAEAEQQKEWEELKDNLIQVAQDTELLHGLELDNTDKNEVLSFILDRDEVTGESEFMKNYSDPNMLFKMAWYALKGEEAFKTIEDYYKGKLAEARRESKQQSQQNQTVNRKQMLTR